MKVSVGCISDKGNYREKNQDRAVCHIKKGRQSVLMAACVCDGIGSFQYSEIAAQMLTEGITRWFHGIEDYFPKVMDEEGILEDLEGTIYELNELIYDYRKQMGIDLGCTMSVLLFTDRTYHVFHVGDSRICCVRDRLEQITRDEVSMVEVQGRIKPRLANYVGKGEKLWLNKSSGSIRDKDFFLLGSDGLFKRLVYEDVQPLMDSVKSDRKAQKVCERLLGLVLERGEKDNVSCILVSVT